jgi:hypothetical protein
MVSGIFRVLLYVLSTSLPIFDRALHQIARLRQPAGCEICEWRISVCKKPGPDIACNFVAALLLLCNLRSSLFRRVRMLTKVRQRWGPSVYICNRWVISAHPVIRRVVCTFHAGFSQMVEKCAGHCTPAWFMHTRWCFGASRLFCGVCCDSGT